MDFLRDLDLPVADVVISSDGIPVTVSRDKLQKYIKPVAELLREGGRFVLIDDLAGILPEPELQKPFLDVNLGFVETDVIGGWDGDKFVSKGLIVFEKGDSTPFPSDALQRAMSGWDGSGFIDYCNASSTPVGEKTIAYFRAKGAAPRNA